MINPWAEMEAARRELDQRKRDTPRRARKRLTRAEAALAEHERRARVEGYAGGLYGTYWDGEHDYPCGAGTGVRERERARFEAQRRLLKAEVDAASAALRAFV